MSRVKRSKPADSRLSWRMGCPSARPLLSGDDDSISSADLRSWEVDDSSYRASGATAHAIFAAKEPNTQYATRMVRGLAQLHQRAQELHLYESNRGIARKQHAYADRPRQEADTAGSAENQYDSMFASGSAVTMAGGSVGATSTSRDCFPIPNSASLKPAVSSIADRTVPVAGGAGVTSTLALGVATRPIGVMTATAPLPCVNDDDRR